MCMQHRLPLNNLNTFASAAEHLSFQQAADSLYVTPSAVSHQVRNLEKILGYKLFNRLDKGVSLTPQGEVLFADIRLPMKQIHEASRKALRGLSDNTLALSVAPVFATGWLLPRLKGFYAHHAEINLSVIATTDLVDFQSDPFDASIRMGRGGWEDIESIRLFNQEIVAVCHPALLDTNKSMFTPAQMLEVNLIDNLSMAGLWKDWFRSAGINAHFKNSIKLQVQSSAQVIEALQSGDAIGLIDRKFISNDIESGRLAIACDHVLYSEDGYFLAFPSTAKELTSFQIFRDWLCHCLEIDI